MRTLHPEWDELLEAGAPPLLDLAELERLVTRDELAELDDPGDCRVHDSCRPIRA